PPLGRVHGRRWLGRADDLAAQRSGSGGVVDQNGGSQRLPPSRRRPGPIPAMGTGRRRCGGGEAGKIIFPLRSEVMSDPINIRALQPGTRVVTGDGAVAEIVSNPADGVWLFARYLESPRDP